MDEVRLIEIKEDILSDNKVQAEELRKNLKEKKSFLMNIMSSPGAGKTTLILKTIEKIRDELKVAVMEADIDSKVDAEKIAAQGIEAIQIRTGGFCHMDSTMVAQGLKAMDLGAIDLVILENVGNLVCPAEFDTGANMNVMLLSVPEGDDQPLKYPLMFTISDVLIVHKIDYLELSDFDLEALRERALTLNPKIKIFEVSSKTGQGVDEWANWLKSEVKAFGGN
ncbi:MAG: hydrogenase nickel incorporation protein HypB [Deltaproteobacteria bacterium]|nr:hydrogenase nickel incorporation protein HypB [Deltaproteobacteria bacterium]